MIEISHELIQLLLFGLVVGLIAGALAGTLAGLAGIGGGLIYVPIFYLTMPGDQQTLSIHVMASLIAVAMTGFFSARAHWRLGHLNREAFCQLIPGLMTGAAIGLWSTLKIPGAMILFALAFLDMWIAWDYGRKQGEESVIPLATLSGPIGYFSGALGIGGGTMLVPLLRRMLSLREAIGTSAACGMVMALSAVIFNILLESVWLNQIFEQQIFLAGALAGILMIIPKTSSWSASLHQSVPEMTMKRSLKGVFIGLSTLLFLSALVSL